MGCGDRSGSIQAAALINYLFEIAYGVWLQVRISDIAPPEIFVSGLYLIDSGKRKLVEDALDNVQNETDVLRICSSGSGGIESIAQLRTCSFVVLLLSDMFLRNRQCRAELTAAVRARKRIIPVLVPAQSQEDSGGWTQAGAKRGDFLNHAEAKCESDHVRIMELELKILKLFPQAPFPSALMAEGKSKFVDPQAMDFETSLASDIRTFLQRPEKVGFNIKSQSNESLSRTKSLKSGAAPVMSRQASRRLFKPAEATEDKT